jgi:molybdate transport system ATP-binding protein
MLQRPGLFAHLDVAHNVAFGLHDAVWSAPTAAIERAREALDALGLGHLAARAPSTLSGGEAQKVALLRMLVRSPRAWLLDEPLTGLDLVARRELLVLLGELAARERDTTAPAPRLVVVHDPRDALALASRWVVMDEGRVVAHGLPTKLARVAPSAYVDALLAEVGELTAHHEPAINGVVPAARAAQPATPAAPPSAGRGDP